MDFRVFLAGSDSLWRGRLVASVDAFVPCLAKSIFVLGVLTETLSQVSFVDLEVTFTPSELAVTFESQNVGGQTVKKPAVMARYDHTACKVSNCFFQSPQCIDIQVIRWLVE